MYRRGSRLDVRPVYDVVHARALLWRQGSHDASGSLQLAQIETGTKPQLQVIHLLTQPDAGWQGEKGRLDREKIQRLCGDRLTTSTFFLCCPPAMTRGLVQILAELRVPDSRISFEYFSL